jgi:hypothetical protein
MSLGLLDDYAPLTEVARDLKVHPKTVRRQINKPDGWPFIEWGGKIWLHVPTVKQLVTGNVRKRNQRAR